MSNIIRYEDVSEIAKAMASSEYFAKDMRQSQAIVKIIAGQELGLGPFASMSGIHIIQGKPVLGANLLATLIKNDPRYDYRVTEHTNDVCSIDFYQGGALIGNATITIKELQKAGSKNLDKYPKNMLFARAISNGAKWHTPGIFGGAPVYTPDEFDLDVDEDGDPVIIESTIREVEDEPEQERAPWTTPSKGNNWPSWILDTVVDADYCKATKHANSLLNLSTIKLCNHPPDKEIIWGVVEAWLKDYKKERPDSSSKVTAKQAAATANNAYDAMYGETAE